jgi:hypothetical protein
MDYFQLFRSRPGAYCPFQRAITGSHFEMCDLDAIHPLFDCEFNIYYAFLDSHNQSHNQFLLFLGLVIGCSPGIFACLVVLKLSRNFPIVLPLQPSCSSGSRAPGQQLEVESYSIQIQRKPPLKHPLFDHRSGAPFEVCAAAPLGPSACSPLFQFLSPVRTEYEIGCCLTEFESLVLDLNYSNSCFSSARLASTPDCPPPPSSFSELERDSAQSSMRVPVLLLPPRRVPSPAFSVH